MSVLKVITTVLLSSLLISCSIFERSTRQNRPAPQVRNIPHQARHDQYGLKKRLIVLPFLDVKLQRPQKVTDVARSTVLREVHRSQNYVVIPNSDFPKGVKSFLTESNEYDMEALSKVAMNMGVAAVLEGKILEIKARKIGDNVGLFRKIRARIDVKVRVRVFGTKNGAEIMNEIRTATVESETTRVAKYTYSDRFLEEDPTLIRSAIQKAFRGAMLRVYQSVEKLSWEGRVALISGDRIYVNAGRLSGIQVGDILKIMEEGDEVFDPETGSFIGRAPGRMKGTLEVVSYFGKDGSIGIIHSGSGFKENDKVELY